MAIGVAVANAILLVTFAERDRIDGAAGIGGRRYRRGEPVASDPDDDLRHGRRHVADGDRPWRGRRSKPRRSGAR